MTCKMSCKIKIQYYYYTTIIFIKNTFYLQTRREVKEAPDITYCHYSTLIYCML